VYKQEIDYILSPSTFLNIPSPIKKRDISARMVKSFFLAVVLLSLSSIVSGQSCTYWGQEACDSSRSSSIKVVPKKTSPTVIFHRLGNHAMRIRGVWPTLPSIAPNGQVVIAACSNNLLIFDPPELTTGALDPNTVIPDSGPYSSYMNVQNYAASTDISLDGTVIQPSSTAVITEDNKVFWVNREQSMLYSYDLLRGANVMAKINITDRTTNHDGFWTYKAEFPLLYYGGFVHMPDPNYHAALRVSTSDGESVYSDSTDLALPAHRLQGSCGSTGGTIDTDKSVTWLDYGTTGTGGDNYGAYSIDSDGKTELWRSNVKFDSGSQEFSHPVHLDFTSFVNGLQCDVALVWETQGVRISGMNSKTGNRCGVWETNEDGGYPGSYLIKDPNTENANWVSGPAVIKDDDYNGYWLYAVVNLARAANQSQVCTLLQVFVNNVEVFFQTGQYYTRRMRYTNCNSAPLAMLDLYGPGQHGIAVLLSNGTLAYFLHSSEGQASLKTSFSLFPYLPDGNLPAADRPAYDFAGNYMAATTSASLLFVVHERNYPNLNAAYLVAVVGGHLGAPPVPGSNSGGGAAAAANSSTNSVDIPGAVFGSICSLIAVAVMIVYFAPNSAPAKSIMYVTDSVNNLIGSRKTTSLGGGGESVGLLKTSASVSKYTTSAPAFSNA
jgi:hypothetical protein